MMDEGPGQETLSQALAGRAKNLSGDMVLEIIELAAPGIVVWEVRRDPRGVAQARRWDPVPWSEFCNADALSVTKIARFVRERDRSRLLLVRSDTLGPYAIQACEMAMAVADESSAYGCRERFEELLGRVLAAEPITQWYELIALHQTISGRLAFTSIPLFPPGARRGDRKSFSVRCEPGDEYGTVFAVAAVESPGRARLLSVHSVKLTAGTYNLTAELRRPGLVRLDGLPTKLRPERRTWPALVASVPVQHRPLYPSHLICAVELSGSDAQVRDRLDRVDQLIKTAARGTQQRLSVSLITYGPHAVHWNSSEEPVRVLTWAQSGAEALERLWRLEGHAADIGYPRAAELECVLTEIAERLTGQEGRPVLVTVGSRPAFPARVDPTTEIIPCPKKNDWRKALHALLEYPGIAFGAISDRDPDGGIWTSLGTDAFAPINAFDVRRFAAKLGLLSVNIPFPLVGGGVNGVAGSTETATPRSEKDSTTRFVEELVGIGASDVTMLEQDLVLAPQSLHSVPDVLTSLRSNSGEIRVPAPPRDKTADFPVTIYVSDEKIHRQVEEAVEEVLKRAQLSIYSREDPLAGSWFRRMWAKSAATGERGLLGGISASRPGQDAAMTATLMANLGPLIQSLQNTPDAVVRLEAVLIVKVNGVLSVNQLTSGQQKLLNERPQLAADPAEILTALGLLPPYVGGMDYPYGGED